MSGFDCFFRLLLRKPLLHTEQVVLLLSHEATCMTFSLLLLPGMEDRMEASPRRARLGARPQASRLPLSFEAVLEALVESSTDACRECTGDLGQIDNPRNVQPWKGGIGFHWRFWKF